MKKIIFFILVFFVGLSVQASHLIGAEIGYRHVSGNSYQINVNIYGDCDVSGTQNIYNNFFDPGTITRVFIYNGNTLVDSIDCQPQTPYGTEITPICDNDTNASKCKSPVGTIEGISEFRFSSVYNLGSVSSNWRFVFDGILVTSLGGRTNAITNINLGTTGSLVYLEARLNNLVAPNSSPILTTVPTPYFCINQQQQYNPGANDVNNDSLYFRLTDALVPLGFGNGSTPATYLAGYSGLAPLAASSFGFNNQTGQLNFVPNLVQKSTVVYQIEEYRNGVLVGTMMREMNFIALNCSNQSPQGELISVTGADYDTTQGIIKGICFPDSLVTMVVQSLDPDSNNITATVSGLSPGSTYTVQDNGTPHPKVTINFIVPFPIVSASSFSVFVTLQDDACPISSKQQIAFTVQIDNPITITPSSVLESCLPGNDGIINIAALSSNSGNLLYNFNNQGFQNQTTFSGLSAGDYPISVRDSLGCIAKTVVNVDSVAQLRINALTKTDVTCHAARDGRIQVSALPAQPSNSYTIIPGFQSSGSGQFNFLTAGTYTVIANAPFGCSDTGSITLVGPPDIEFITASTTDDRCDKSIGRIDIQSNITIPREYSISPNQQTNGTGSFGGLSPGQYIITVRDSNGCYKDTILTVENDPTKITLGMSKQDVSCEGNGSDGEANVIVGGALPPLTYLWESIYGTEGTGSSIFNQRSGVKRVYVTDAIGCSANNYITIDPANCCSKVFIPNAFSPNGDGRNETFNLRSPLTMNEVKFIVANRWGQIVWRANNQLDSWDGNYKDGTPADIGVYHYFLRYQCDSDKATYKLQGDLTVIR